MEKLHDRLLQLTSDGVCRFTLRSGRILLANAGLVRLVDRSGDPERLVGDTLDRLMVPMEGLLLRERIVDNKKPQSFEYRFLTPSKSERHVTVHATVAHGRQAGEKAVEAIFLSKAVPEKGLGEREVWLNSLVEHTSDAFLIHDAEGCLIEANGRACGLLGYASEELLGQNLRDLVTGAHEKTVTDLWRQVGALGQATIDVYLQRKDGTRLSAEIHASTIASGGRASMLCLIRDTAERRRSEEEIRRLRAELERRPTEGSDKLESTTHELQSELTARQRAEEAWREQSGFLGVLLETAPVPIFFKDASGRYVGCNRAFEQFLGMSRERIVGKTVHEIAPPASAEVYEKADRELLQSGGAQRYESEVSAAQGAVRDVVFYKAVFNKADGTRGGLVGVIMDVTERHKAEREIRALNETLRERALELETANRELQTFSYSVSHDLRAPLRSVNGFAAALEEDHSAALSEEARIYLRRIRLAAKRMDELIEDLLKLSRVLRAELHREAIDLSQLAGSVADELRRAWPDQQVEVTILPGMACEGDARLLRIVLENLLSNAWKFTAGRTPARVEVGCEWSTGSAVFYVRDNGTGFDMAHVRKLFVPFQRLHSADQFPGNGIGLATVQRILARHGGKAWAEGRPGEGAAFFFIVGGKQAEAPATASEEQGASSE